MKWGGTPVTISSTPVANTLVYNSQNIGTLSGGSGGVPLTATLNSNATPAATAAILKQLAYRNAGDDPGSLTRTIRFQVTDNSGNGSNTPTVTVGVNAINDVPVITGVSGTTGYEEGDWLTPLALTNAEVDDPDFHGGTLTATISANAHEDDRLGIRWGGGGALTIEGNVIKHNSIAVATFSGGEGSAPLVIALNFNSNETVARDILRQISYRNDGNNPGSLTRTISVVLSDGPGSDSGTVNVTVTPTVPIIGGITSAVTFSEDGSPVLLFPSATVTDPNFYSYDGGSIVVSYLSGRGGSDRLDVVNTSLITVNATAKTLSYGGEVFATYSGEGWSPQLTISFNDKSARASAEAALRSIAFSNTNYSNPSTNDRVLKVHLTDASGGTWDDQTVHITAVNDAPTASGESYNLVVSRNNLSLSVAASGVLANDSDVDGTVTAQIVTPPNEGMLSLSANGAFTYSPRPGFIGQDSFSYRAFDGVLYSPVQTVTINVSNPTPVASDDSFSATLNAGQPMVISAPGVLGNDSDANDTVLAAHLVSAPTRGMLTLNADGSFSYWPTSASLGGDSFTYYVSDGWTNSNTATVSLTVSNPSPSAQDDSYSVPMNGGLTVSAPGVLQNDSDPNDAQLMAVLVTNAQHGMLTFNANGSFSYSPMNGWSGTDTFTYKAYDNWTWSDEATVTIEVNEMPDLIAHRTGNNWGERVSADVENAGNPADYIVLTNNDRDLQLPEAALDFDSPTAVPTVDDDLAKITLQPVPVEVGSAQLFVSHPEAVRLYKSDGTLLTSWSVDFASPVGDLESLAHSPLDLYLEALSPVAHFTISLVYSATPQSVTSSDTIHMMLADFEVIHPSNATGPVVPMDAEELLDLVHDSPDAVPLSDDAQYKVHIDAMPVFDTTINVTSNWESYTDTLTGHASLTESQLFSVAYESESGNPLSTGDKDAVLTELGVRPVLLGDDAFVQITRPKDGFTRPISKFNYSIIDTTPDYSNDADQDSDSYFVRENDDFKNLDIYYRLSKNDDFYVQSVRFYIYEGSTATKVMFGAKDYLEGELDANGNYKAGPLLHVVWEDARNPDGTFRDAGFYRVEMVVKVLHKDALQELRTPIVDGNTSVGGWQSHKRGLIIHDLIWKHRPVVHTSGAEKEKPIDPGFFRQNAGLYKKVGDTNQLVKATGVTEADLLANDSVEHFLDRDANGSINAGANLPAESTVNHTANRTDAVGIVFLQYWFFYDASESAAVAGAGSPYHEGDVEAVQVAIRLEPDSWKDGVSYSANAVVMSDDKAYIALQAHIAAPSNVPGNKAFWKETSAKSWWFLPYAATASQHYYAQTLRWNLHDGSAADTPQHQTWVQHDDNNERFNVFIAVGTHATYFASGTFNVPDIIGEDPSKQLGTQIQYTVPGAFDVAYETAGSAVQAIDVWAYPTPAFEQWTGHWGFKTTAQGAPFTSGDRDGPQGLAKRFAIKQDGSHLILRPNPKTLHNAALRHGDEDLAIE